MEIAPVTFRATQSHANAARDHGHAPPPPGTANRSPKAGTTLLSSPNAPETAPPAGATPALHSAPPPPGPAATTTLSPQAQAMTPPTAPSIASEPPPSPTAHAYSSAGEPLSATGTEGGQIDVRA
jgi:hypothetical protein